LLGEGSTDAMDSAGQREEQGRLRRADPVHSEDNGYLPVGAP
jgi:hypothetical protein